MKNIPWEGSLCKRCGIEEYGLVRWIMGKKKWTQKKKQ